MNQTLKKGDRIRAEWLKITDAALAGTQPKVAAVSVVVEGRVTHVYGYGDKTSPTKIEVWVQPDEGTEVVVDPKHVVAILGST